MDVQTLVNQIEAEFQAERDAIAKEKRLVQTRKTELVKKETEIEAKALEIAEVEKGLAPKLEEIARVEGKLMTEKQIQAEKADAIAAKGRAEQFNKEAQGKLDDAKLKLAEVTKRELALSEREKTYKDQIEKELLKQFLNR